MAKSLTERLVTKAESLRNEQARQAGASVAFIAASQKAEDAAVVAAAHATAVEQALDIITKAGVTL